MLKKFRHFFNSIFVTHGRFNRYTYTRNFIILYVVFYIYVMILPFLSFVLLYHFILPMFSVVGTLAVQILFLLINIHFTLKFLSFHIRRIHDIKKGISGKWLVCGILLISLLLVFKLLLRLPLFKLGLIIPSLFPIFLRVCTSFYLCIPLMLIPGNSEENQYGFPDERSFKNDQALKNKLFFWKKKTETEPAKVSKTRTMSSADLLKSENTLENSFHDKENNSDK